MPGSHRSILEYFGAVDQKDAQVWNTWIRLAFVDYLSWFILCWRSGIILGWGFRLQCTTGHQSLTVGLPQHAVSNSAQRKPVNFDVSSLLLSRQLLKLSCHLTSEAPVKCLKFEMTGVSLKRWWFLYREADRVRHSSLLLPGSCSIVI